MGSGCESNIRQRPNRVPYAGGGGGGGGDVNLSGDVRASASTEDRSRRSIKAGMFGGGGGALHPSLIEPTNLALTPNREEVSEAEGIVQYFEELDARGEVSGELNGQVVDRWEAQRSRKLLDWAEACQRRDRWKEAVLSTVES